MQNAPSIPDGLYITSTGNETVEINGGQVTFHIELIGKHAGQMFDRSYKYRLRTNGQFHPYPVRSVDAVFGIGKFEWLWDGTHIVQKNSTTDEVMQEFSRKP